MLPMTVMRFPPHAEHFSSGPMSGMAMSWEQVEAHIRRAIAPRRVTEGRDAGQPMPPLTGHRAGRYHRAVRIVGPAWVSFVVHAARGKAVRYEEHRGNERRRFR
jgi:hypothetical protein